MIHELPACRIVEVAEMAEERRKRQPLVGLDPLQFGPAAEQMDLRAGFERSRRIVEGRRAGAEDGDTAASEGREVDGVGRMGAHVGRQSLDECRHRPPPACLDAMGQHDMARQDGPFARGVPDARPEQAAVRGHAEQLRSDLDGKCKDTPEPVQVLAPALARDLVQAREGLRAMLRLEPALIGEAWNAEVRTGHRLPGPECLHAAERAPGALGAGRAAVDHEVIVDPLQLELERQRLPALATAHDQNVENLLARRPGRRLQPAQFGIGDQSQVAPHLGIEFGESLGRHGMRTSMAAIARRRAKR